MLPLSATIAWSLSRKEPQRLKQLKSLKQLKRKEGYNATIGAILNSLNDIKLLIFNAKIIYRINIEKWFK